MKYIYLFAVIFISSCAQKNYPIKGTFPEPPITYTTETSVDTVWSNIIDYFAISGISIDVIDRSSGLIVTKDYSFKGLYTFENRKTGKVNDQKAYLVSSWGYIPAIKKTVYPNVITGNWNVRIKRVGEKTSVNINVTNIRSYVFVTDHYITNRVEASFDVRTTGVFEQLIFNKVK